MSPQCDQGLLERPVRDRADDAIAGNSLSALYAGLTLEKARRRESTVDAASV